MAMRYDPKSGDRLTAIHNRVYIIPPRENVYLGRQILDTNMEGFSDLSEVRAILAEIEEDYITVYDQESYDGASRSFAITQRTTVEKRGSITLSSKEAICIETKTFNARLMLLRLIVSKSNKGELSSIENKEIAINLINKLRVRAGLDKITLAKTQARKSIETPPAVAVMATDNAIEYDKKLVDTIKAALAFGLLDQKESISFALGETGWNGDPYEISEILDELDECIEKIVLERGTIRSDKLSAVFNKFNTCMKAHQMPFPIETIKYNGRNVVLDMYLGIFDWDRVLTCLPLIKEAETALGKKVGLEINLIDKSPIETISDAKQKQGDFCGQGFIPNHIYTVNLPGYYIQYRDEQGNTARWDLDVGETIRYLYCRNQGSDGVDEHFVSNDAVQGELLPTDWGSLPYDLLTEVKWNLPAVEKYTGKKVENNDPHVRYEKAIISRKLLAGKHDLAQAEADLKNRESPRTPEERITPAELRTKRLWASALQKFVSDLQAGKNVDRPKYEDIARQ